MDNYKSPKTTFYLSKELKNLPKPPQKENISLKNLQKKNNMKKNIFSPKQNMKQTKTKSGNVIKETIIFNVPRKGKGRSLEKVPSTKNIQNKNIYLNYLDFNPNIKRAGFKNKEKNINIEKKTKEKEPENNDYKKYNSVCVSINNNYNYNVSLGNTNSNNDKMREKPETWQEKLQRINKQKENMNYLDYKKLTETDFFKNKFAQKEKEEMEQKLNKSENDLNFKQKIRELNSAPPPSIQTNNYKIEKKNEINEVKETLNINNEMKNTNKKKTGILGFLQAFKDLLEPINLKKKTNIKPTLDNNSNINNINNKISVNLKTNENEVIHIPTTPRIDNNNIRDNNFNNKYSYNSVNTTPKVTLYERKNILSKNEEYNNNYNNMNYYSDNAYDSCPVQKNNSYIYTHKNKNINKDENKNDNKILSLSQRNIFENNNNNNIYLKGRTEYGRFTDKREYYNNNSERRQKETGLFNIFGFGKKEPFYENVNHSNTYIKKPKEINSPINYMENKEISNFSYREKNPNPYSNNNNIFANYLNDLNTPKEHMNKPLIKQKLLEKFDDDYNDENLNENLNINAEKKIQEIKINIRHKKDNYNMNNNYQNINNNKINHSAIYTNKKVYNTLDDLIMNPKPQNKIETCVINFNQNKNMNRVYNTPKTSYNKNKFEENFNDNYNNNNYNSNKYYNTYNNNFNNDVYSKPVYDLSQSQRNISHKMSIDSDSDNQSTNSAYTSKPIRKKIVINKSERVFKVNKIKTNESGDTDSESNSEISEISQTSTKSVKPNTIYFKHFKSFFNKNKKGNSISNNFLNKIFRRDKKYDTDDSFNSENSNISNNSFNIANIKQKISNKNLHLFKKIYNYNITTPKNIKKGYYITKNILKVIKLPRKNASIYTKEYYKIIERPKMKIKYIDKKRIRIKDGMNLPLLKDNCYFFKKNVIVLLNKKEQSFENIDINNENNENININEEIKIKNKNYFSPYSPKNKENNSMTLSPQFGTKKEPSYNKNIETPVLNPSKSARDFTKIISIEIDLNNNPKNNTQQNTPIRDLSSSVNNLRMNNQTETLYIRKKPSMKKLNDDNKCKTYMKESKKLYESINLRNISAFDIDSEDTKYKKKNNKIMSIDINLKQNTKNNKISNNNDDIHNKIISTLEKLNNIQLLVDQLLIIITQKNEDNSNNNIRLPFMEILSNENFFAKIIIKKSTEENNQKKILNYAIICQQLCLKLNENLNLNNINQVDEDLKTILAEEAKLKFENVINNTYTINDNTLFGITIFISELINLKVIPINQGFYCFENLYKKYKIANRNKYYYLDVIIILLNKIGENLFKEKVYKELNIFIDKELVDLLNTDNNLPLFLRNKIIELTKIKKYQWMLA